MLADGVEAAARVLNDPTPQKIREVVDRIVRQRVEQGQLRDAPLTQAQLETVKEQFTRVLAGHVPLPHRLSGVERRHHGGVRRERHPLGRDARCRSARCRRAAGRTAPARGRREVRMIAS